MANYRALARRYARRRGINPRLFERQIDAESGFNPRSGSSAGAIGIAQIMPATARSWGVNPNDPRASLDAAAKAMAGYLRAYRGSWDKALRAYNAGPGAVERSRGFGETNAYVAKILGGRRDVRNSVRPATGGRRSGGRPGSVTISRGTVQPGGTGLAPLLKSIMAQQRVSAAASVGPPPPPTFSAQPTLPAAAMPSGYQPPAPSTSSLAAVESQQKSLSAQLAQVSSLRAAGTPAVRVNVRPGVRGVAPGRVGRDGIPRGKPSVGWRNFEGKKVAAWIYPYLVYARRNGWKGRVNEGYRSYGEQVRIWNSGVRPAARPGASKHGRNGWPFGGAVDVSDPAGLARILRRRGTKRLQWAGAKDPPHFSFPYQGSY